jgi:uncharacterized protein (TIGR02145 family)
MKIRFLSLFLIGSLVTTVMLSSCKKENDDNNSNGGTNGTTGTFTDSRDSKTYKWVKIGDQIWMAENLAYIGSDIQHITTDLNEWANNTDYDGWCYYQFNENYGTTYGALYQWEAAKSACPEGWHLPTDIEWGLLIGNLGGGDVAGGKMKELGIAHWDDPNTGADNSSGFSALAGGSRDTDGGFDGLGWEGNWWSATENSSDNAYYRTINYMSAKVYRKSYSKLNGSSVRCVRD